MKVVILCGGKGTRIRDVSEILPKPMIPIGEKPIVEHIMEIYGEYGFNDFVLCLGYKGWKLKEYFLNYRYQTFDFTVDLAESDPITFLGEDNPNPWKVTLAETGLETGTGARIKKIKKYLKGQPFMLTYGDGVGNIDIKELLKFHKSHGKLATITSVRPPSRFGKMVIEDGTVVDFQEKPQAGAGLINGGFFVFEPGVFDYIPDDDSCFLEREPLQELARDRELMTYVHDGFWMPMDTLREYNLLNEMWDKGNPPWKRGDR